MLPSKCNFYFCQLTHRNISSTDIRNISRNIIDISTTIITRKRIIKFIVANYFDHSKSRFNKIGFSLKVKFSFFCTRSYKSHLHRLLN